MIAMGVCEQYRAEPDVMSGEKVINQRIVPGRIYQYTMMSLINEVTKVFKKSTLRPEDLYL